MISCIFMDLIVVSYDWSMQFNIPDLTAHIVFLMPYKCIYTFHELNYLPNTYWETPICKLSYSDIEILILYLVIYFHFINIAC